MDVKRCLIVMGILMAAVSGSFGQKLQFTSMLMIPDSHRPNAVSLMKAGGATISQSGCTIEFDLIVESETDGDSRCRGFKYKKSAVDTLAVGDAVIMFINDLAFQCSGAIGINRSCRDETGVRVIPGDAQDKLAGAWKTITITAIQREPGGMTLQIQEKVILSDRREVQSLRMIEKDDWYHPEVTTDTPPAHPQE